MGYTPKRVKSSYARGDAGVAKIKIHPNGKQVRVTFKDGETYTLPKAKCPDQVQEGEFYAQMNSDNSELMSIRPQKGMFTVKVAKFVAKENEKPSPKVRTVNFVKDGKNISYDVTQFTVLLDILAPKQFKGIQIPLTLRYNFLEDKEEDGSFVGFMEKGEHTEFLIEFCDITGVWERGAMKWKDNVLPMLERRILDADKKFSVLVKNGFVNAFYDEEDQNKTTPDVEEIDEDEEQSVVVTMGRVLSALPTFQN